MDEEKPPILPITMLFSKLRHRIIRFWLSYPRKAIRAIPVIIYSQFLMYTKPELNKILRTVPGLLSLIDAYHIEGDFKKAKRDANVALEFGAFKGRSTVILSRIAKNKGCMLYTFEWFSGLGDVDDEDILFQKGEYRSTREEFEDNVARMGEKKAVKLIEGDIKKTINKVSGTFDYAFVDVDLYTVTKLILLKLLGIAKGGEIIDIHDNHSPGIRKAIREAIKASRKTAVVKSFPFSLVTQIRVSTVRD